MAVTLSKNSQISVNVGEDLIGQLISWDYSDTDTQVDITSNDSGRKEYVNLGLIDGEFNCEAQFDLADVGHSSLRTILGAAGGLGGTLTIYPNGNVIGQIKLVGQFITGSYSVTASGVEDVISSSFSGKIVSAFVESVIT